jgi:hypothetical protein
MGQSGAIAMLILLFLAVTSACSAEQIAVSSLLTYDIYGTYVNKQPSERQILWVSHMSIFGYSLFMGAIATAFKYIGVSMGYLYTLMGTIIGSAVVPIALCITWKKTNGTGAVAGAIVGFCAGIAGWLGLTAKLNDGVINVTTSAGDYEMLTGNLLAIGVGGIITVGWTLVFPADFDWDITRSINNAVTTSIDGVATPPEGRGEKDEKVSQSPNPEMQVGEVSVEQQVDDLMADQRGLKRAFRFAAVAALILTFVLIFVSRPSGMYECVLTLQAIPLPLFFSSHVYTLGGFTAWVCISLLWLFVGLILIGIYPLWEARGAVTSVSVMISG